MVRNVLEDFFFLLALYHMARLRKVCISTDCLYTHPIPISQVNMLCLENSSFILGVVFISILSLITLELDFVIRVQMVILIPALNP